MDTVKPLQRVLSWTVDAIVFLLVVALWNKLTSNSVLSATLAFVSYAAYTVGLPAKGFATLGHMAVGLRVVPINEPNHNAYPDWVVFGARSTIFLLLAFPLLVGTVLSAITMFSHPTFKAWHDVATGTTMIKVAPWQFSRRPFADHFSSQAT